MTQPCEKAGCRRPAKARGMCENHYQRETRHSRARPDRLIANRARTRATKWLIAMHPDEFRALVTQALEQVNAEVVRHREAMPDAPDNVPRLRSGPRPADEAPEDRISVVQKPSEVTTCPRCRFLHATNHECPDCSLSAPRPKVLPQRPQQSTRDRVLAMLLAGKKPTWIIDQGESRGLVLSICAELERAEQATA